jgi:hypothetical protein
VVQSDGATEPYRRRVSRRRGVLAELLRQQTERRELDLARVAGGG